MKINLKIVALCVVCFLVGGGVGYGLSVFANYVANNDAGEIMCPDNAAPDENGCCPGEIYTDMGDQGFNCCPDDDGDCFPPIR